jgi:hypothetical protein
MAVLQENRYGNMQELYNALLEISAVPTPPASQPQPQPTPSPVGANALRERNAVNRPLQPQPTPSSVGADIIRPLPSNRKRWLAIGAVIVALILVGGGLIWGLSGGNTPTPPPTVTYNVNDIVDFGGYEWRVLEVSGGKALLLSEYVLEHRAYNGEYHNGEYHENMTLEELEALATTWADCDLRAYLNGEFLNSFSQSDRERIAETRNDNQDNQWFYAEAMASGDNWWIQYAPRGGADTSDRIFLLSLEEVAKYFGDSGQLRNRPNNDIYWIDDQYNEARVARCLSSCPYDDYHSDGGYGSASWWWLRSPGSYSIGAANVYFDGNINVGGDVINGWSAGVRPALWLNL